MYPSLDGIDVRYHIASRSENAIAKYRSLRIYQLIDGRNNGAIRAAREKDGRPLLRTYAGFDPFFAKLVGQTGLVHAIRSNVTPHTGMRYLRVARQQEGAEGGIPLFADWLAVLEDEGSSQTIEKPVGVLSPLYANAANLAQRS